MAGGNGHEVLLSYSSDAVYLYSTLDAVSEPSTDGSSTTLSSNTGTDKRSPSPSSPSRNSEEMFVPGGPFRRALMNEVDAMMDEDIEQFMTGAAAGYADEGMDIDEEGEGHSESDEEEEEEEENIDEFEVEQEYDPFDSVPVVLPRRQFKGHCNVETVKDVNFLGPRDEFVVSGSDDGNWFLWDKDSGKLRDILEGDGQVVNVIEGHPHLPLVAVSGIDTTVKLFGPKQGNRRFSRLGNAEAVTSRNASASSQRIDLAALSHYARIARLIGHTSSNEEDPPCTTQ
ncbi:hypothetical protein EIP91_006700 [Steccherinum ochraceum]|uniref:Uncharacterized protein n=1 Tax=Steccherinum ochraceum TaxID=92696 RepID=A0A4R0RR37_9APHY|nr:hypothetical protein EIP91_006700 [Steccherinum ochraceum]